jgi:hypothetical protein
MGNFLLQLSLLHVASVEQDRWRSWWTLQEISGCVFHSELVEEVVARLRMSWTGDASPAVQNAMGFANMEFPTGVGGVIDWPCFCWAPGTRGLVGHWRTPSTHLDWVPEKQQKRVACEFFEAKFPWCEIWHDGVKTEDMRTACVVLLSWIASFLSVDLWCCGSTRGQVKWLHLGKGLGQRADVQGWFFFFSSWLSEKNSRLAHFFVEAAGDDRLEGLSWRDGVGQDRTVLDLGAMRVQEWDGGWTMLMTLFGFWMMAAFLSGVCQLPSQRGHGSGGWIGGTDCSAAGFLVIQDSRFLESWTQMWFKSWEWIIWVPFSWIPHFLEPASLWTWLNSIHWIHSGPAAQSFLLSESQVGLVPVVTPTITFDHGSLLAWRNGCFACQWLWIFSKWNNLVTCGRKTDDRMGVQTLFLEDMHQS